MSEMLANQYFIAERYFEALGEYSKLSKKQKSNPVIKKKLIICAALNNDFEKALSVLTEWIVDNFKQSFEIQNDPDEYHIIETTQKLEKEILEKKGDKELKKMQIAILSYFSDQTKSFEIFNQLKDSIFQDIVNSFLQTLQSTTH